MVLRPLSDKLQDKAERELNEEPARIEECLHHLREWLQKQPHLNIRSDDQALIVFLRGCKWSLQRTKEKIDCFYTVRTLIPDLFSSKDPFSPAIQSMLQKGVFHPLAKVKNSDGPRLCLLNWSVVDPVEMSLINVFKLMYMSFDLLLYEDDNFVISGMQMISDYSKLPLTYLVQFTPATMKKVIISFQNAYPIRLKQCVAINCYSAVETMYNSICKPFLSSKLQKRVKIYSIHNSNSIYSDIPKAALPVEYGGENGSISVLASEWRQKVESYRDWFLDDGKFVSDESLRPGKPKTYTEEFNMEGTFRKLVID